MRGIGNSERAFTLLEVMIALALAATALTVLLTLGNRSLLVGDRVQRLTAATLLAQQKMTELELASRRAGFEARPEEGTFAEPNAGYRWRTGYSETPLGSVRRVDVVVVWGEERRNEAVELTSFVFLGSGGG